MRKLRHIPVPHSLVEVTTRTFQGRAFLRPDPELCELVAGVLGRACELYAVRLVWVTFMSNHYHMLVIPPDADTLSDFMEHLNGNLAREVGKLRGWKGKFWEKRYEMAPVSEEPEAQIGRLCYLMAQGTKEGLVARPQDWPGVHTAQALLDNRPIRGTWFDRTAEYSLRRGGRTPDPARYTQGFTLQFAKLPCWDHLDDVAYRSDLESLADKVIQEGAEARRELGINVLSRRDRQALCEVDPLAVCGSLEPTPAPPFHAASLEARQKLRQAYADFVSAYRAATDRVRDKQVERLFPQGCFPPPPPFHPHDPPDPEGSLEAIAADELLRPEDRPIE